MIHGHSCCEIRGKNISFICDPWLVGSTYWRSWFNFPKNPRFEDLLESWNRQERIYFYITHLHWDHFHGPTLRKILKYLPNNYIFFIPEVPEKRLKEDLETFVDRKKIVELKHGRKYKLTDEISILSFQTGPFITDSIISISSNNFSLLNMNDAKIFKLSLNHLESLIPTPDYVLRSHSSANARCCYRELNGSFQKNIFDKKRLNYSEDFFNDCYSVNAKVAIPFASNMACLHKETFEYNKNLNFADYVVEDFHKLHNNYGDMKCRLLLPTEKIILEDGKHILNENLRKQLKDISRENYLLNYQKEMHQLLEKQYKIEEKVRLSLPLIKEYFYKVIKLTPFPLKIYLSNKINFEVFSKDKKCYLNLDFQKNLIREIGFIDNKKNKIIIKVNAYVLNDVCRKSNWNSIGVSKRLQVSLSIGNNRFEVFNLICNFFEINNFLPIRKIVNYRFLTIWIRRYRELVDLFLFILKIIILKKIYFRKI